MSTFKDGFLWGGAVAAHQLEGGWHKDEAPAFRPRRYCRTDNRDRQRSVHRPATPHPEARSRGGWTYIHFPDHFLARC